MSKIPRISGNSMIRYLIKKGFVITHRNGSHARLVKNHMYTSVPAGNKTMKIGLQLSVLGDAMIDKEEFVNDHRNKIVR